MLWLIAGAIIVFGGIGGLILLITPGGLDRWLDKPYERGRRRDRLPE